MLCGCCEQFSSIQVSRRYKHFDWLHGRLVEKYCTVAVPPLPEKQIAGNAVKKTWVLKKAQPIGVFRVNPGF